MAKDLELEEEKLDDEELEDLEAGDDLEEVIAELVEEEDGLEKELEDLNEKYLRLQAEYSNYRRRTQEEKAAIYSLGNERLILELLPVLDNFERAIANMQENEVSQNYLDGVEMIRKSLIQVLEKEGLKCIEACGEDFDPDYHHAVLMEESEGVESGKVLEELQKGYRLKEKTIRPTMVKVSK
ncbi:MAG: nucleotide exchange factor GrpE [Tissierellia bacterium]|nr:nucleotide exchange factor GrpE [Tissierellia bacterium]